MQTEPLGVRLLCSDRVARINDSLSTIYANMAKVYFAELSNSQLLARVRTFDNYQRFTFGRGQSSYVIPMLLGDLTFRDLKLIRESDELSYFPDPSARLYRPFTEVIQYSIESIMNATDSDEVHLAVTVLMHRLIVRPGESFRGLLHRDLGPEPGRIGTVIWYPQVRHDLVDDFNFIAYIAPQHLSVERLMSGPPQFSFKPAEYAGNAVSLAYPENYPHGVLTGNHRSKRPCKGQIRDFIEPDSECFVKDLVIVTVSERSPVDEGEVVDYAESRSRRGAPVWRASS